MQCTQSLRSMDFLWQETEWSHCLLHRPLEMLKGRSKRWQVEGREPKKCINRVYLPLGKNQNLLTKPSRKWIFVGKFHKIFQGICTTWTDDPHMAPRRTMRKCIVEAARCLGSGLTGPNTIKVSDSKGRIMSSRVRFSTDVPSGKCGLAPFSEEEIHFVGWFYIINIISSLSNSN